ncbi:RNA polymerase sigma factor [Mycolicibacterium vanbaalenii]|uniref:RNA polymerase, sigma-24 subunit, ECF subfamily n=1 Tax=Mycolicibacterium vanbaalenii (strain DSM 7251 / JCM 13017 / BCRC 16820 / KCTC 9966 / NRRL B-24157 / PYR-1) TaxID=350058 RepID=A1THW7_MYCVP|nr:RNA polymerase subunit sigma-24 [Mycolicibacterium vanbaalenii]ABM16767.1 RNA polymerase, sigma-24 subunit, ECF subfamily [Mycolicibacterium vanbaalenii PYR-1]MCV7126954.1 RNA polymerase subunit sigma-24 [Mycolicibacterium vanbaalenii PYR-1]
MINSEIRISGNAELTTRETVAAEVAIEWLAAHPHVEVTAVDLSKTLQQFITELFLTGGRRQREALSGHAVAVLDQIGVHPEEFAPVRTFAKSADMPVAYGAMVGRVAEALAPLAAAVQLSRIPVTNAAVGIIEPDEGLDRRQLRGFVVGQVRPHAQQMHARVGAGETVDGYLQLILADIGALATAVVESARAKNARPTRLDDELAERTTHFVRTHRAALMGYATPRFGQDADDIVATALLKVAVQFRNNPKLRIGFAYGKAAVDNAAKDLFTKRKARQGRDILDPELLEWAAGTHDDAADVEEVDVMLRMVLSAAAELADEQLGPDACLARETLLQFFLVDPHEIDPRKARLTERALHLTTANEGNGFRTELGEIAAALGAEDPAIKRITELAVAALRAQADKSRRPGPAGGELAA